MQFLVLAQDYTDEAALERRMAVRKQHLNLVKEMKAEGKVHFGSALLDDAREKMVGSIMICEFESEEKLQEWLNLEPYITGKVWEKVEIKPCKVAPSFVRAN